MYQKVSVIFAANHWSDPKNDDLLAAMDYITKIRVSYLNRLTTLNKDTYNLRQSVTKVAIEHQIVLEKQFNN